MGPLPRVLLQDTDAGPEPPLVRPASTELPAPSDRPARLQLLGEIDRTDLQRGPGVDIDAVRASREARVVEKIVDHLREGQRHHDEVHPRGANDQCADHQRDYGAGRQRQWQGQPQVGRIACRRGERQRVGGDAKERCMTEAHQSGVAHQQVE